MKHALTILTYVPEGAHPNVRERLPACIQSLEASGYPAQVSVVDDGSTDAEHQRFLDLLSAVGYPVIRRDNGGNARAKNTCIRVLMEQGIDVGFIAEDDAQFTPRWWNRYLTVHERTGIQHLSWAWDYDPSGEMWKQLVKINGCPVCKTSRVNGVLLTFTPKVIEQVGGLRVLPAPWGHAHTNWTRRIVASGLAPFFADVQRSNELVTINRFGRWSSITPQQKKQYARQNRPYHNDLSVMYCPLEE